MYYRSKSLDAFVAHALAGRSSSLRFAQKYLKGIDIEKARILALVHDGDAEIIFGDILIKRACVHVR